VNSLKTDLEMFNLNKTLAIVTGAARGNGAAIISGFEKAGAKVLAVDTQKTEYKMAVIGDISDHSIIQKVNTIVTNRNFKNLVLINNAGISKPSPSPYPHEDWDITLKVNLTAPFMLIESLIPLFKKTKKGSIINITSLNAELAFPNNPAYNASKGGLKMLTKFYAKSLGEYGVRVNNVGPGYMVTDMTQKSYSNEKLKKSREKHTFLGRWGQPEDLVGVCIFLASDASSYITGQDIYVDGGWTANGLIE